MHPLSRIFVAGHTGRIGRALLKHLAQAGHRKLLTRAQARLDLADPQATDAFFASERPECVFLAVSAWADPAGRVAEQAQPATTLRDDLLIQANVLSAAQRHGVARLLFVVPAGIYPAQAPEPVGEHALLGGPPAAHDRASAVARIAGVELCAAFNRQHGTRFLAVACADTYGPDDRYGDCSERAAPAMLRAFHQARTSAAPHVVLPGSGAREVDLLFTDDVAAGLAFLMRLAPAEFDGLLTGRDPATDVARLPLVNLGSGQPVSMARLARETRAAVGYGGVITFDRQQAEWPAGRALDTRLVAARGWAPRVALAQGLQRTYGDYLQREALGAL